ncbi:MAG: DUF2797 domain-containing protein, partial [Gammaproteobacteria bacterium]
MQGTLSKMTTELRTFVEYALPIGDEHLPMNARIEHPMSLTYTGSIFCDNCGRKTSRSFAQGHCYPCMQRLAACDMCILKPEICHYHRGTCREPEWGESHCMINHIVYVANTSELKVGITRETQIPMRWMDQGATQALPIFRVKTRRISGFVEVALAEIMADKTNWRAILKGNNSDIDLKTKAAEAIPRIAEALAEIKDQFGDNAVEALEADPVSISYPVTEYPQK